MNKFASAYKHIEQIIHSQQEHNLSSQEIESLMDAQKALLLVEMLGLTIHEESQKAI